MLDFLYRMKIKLDAKEKFSILSVTETMSPQEAAVLKTGITRLLKEKKNLVVDLTSVVQPNAELLREIISGFIKPPGTDPDAPDQDELLVVSPLPGVGHAATLDETIKLSGSTFVKMLAFETWIKERIQHFDKKKKELEGKANNAQDAELKTLRKTNSDLKKSIHCLEFQLTELMKVRKDAPSAQLPGYDSLEATRKAVEDTLPPILQKEGILKGGA